VYEGVDKQEEKQGSIELFGKGFGSSVSQPHRPLLKEQKADTSRGKKKDPGCRKDRRIDYSSVRRTVKKKKGEAGRRRRRNLPHGARFRRRKPGSTDPGRK